MPAIIDQIFQQSQAGNANGAITPGFAEGAKLAMERRRLDSELATEDLQRSTMRDMATFNNQMQRLKLEEARLNMQKMVGLQSAATEASRLVAWAIQEPSVLDTPEFRSHAQGVLTNPLSLSTDQGKTLFEMVRGRQAHNAALAAGMTPLSEQIKTPTGTELMGKPLPDMSAEDSPWEVGGFRSNGTPILRRKRSNGDYEEVESELLTKTDAAGRTYTYFHNPKTGRDQIVDSPTIRSREGSLGRGITGATQTRAEATIASGENIVGRARELSKLLRPENVGPRGFFNRAADQFLPNIIPNWKVGDSVEAATVAGELQSSVIHLLKSDSNIAEGERKRLMAAIPDPTRFLSSAAPTEKLKLAQLLLDAGQLSRRAAATKKVPTSPTWLKQSEIQAMWQRGEINDEQATQLLQNSGWALISELRAQAASGQ